MRRVIDRLGTVAVKPVEDDIRIIEVRIRNFRSLVEVDVTLNSTTVLIGTVC